MQVHSINHDQHIKDSKSIEANIVLSESEIGTQKYIGTVDVDFDGKQWSRWHLRVIIKNGRPSLEVSTSRTDKDIRKTVTAKKLDGIAPPLR